MIPVSGGDNSDGDIRTSSRSRGNQTLLKEAILSCSSATATPSPFTPLEKIGKSSSAQSDNLDDDNDDDTLLIKKRQTPELALSHSTTPLTTSTLTRNNLISNGNNNKTINNNRVHVDDNYNYQHQLHQHQAPIYTEKEQHQLNNNHHNQQQQHLLYETGDSNSYQQNYDHHPGDLSESLSTLYLPTLSRQLGTTIMSGLNWINQIDFNNLLQSLVNPSNIFRRRNSATPIIAQNKGAQNGASATLASPLSSSSIGAVDGNASTNSPQLQQYSSSTLQTKMVAKMLNGTLLKPARLQKSSEETIELESFGVVELDNDESGIGHDFQRYENDKPTWCDACAEFLTPPVMNDSGSSKTNATDAAADNEASTTTTTTTTTVNSSEGKTSTTTAETTSTSAPVAVQTDHLMRTYLQCRRCAYVCHLKCTPIIRINCRPAVSAVASSSPPANYRRRSSAGNPSSRRTQRLQRNSVRFDGGSLFAPEAKPPVELLVKEEVVEALSKEVDKPLDSNSGEEKLTQSSPTSALSSPDEDDCGGYPMSTSVSSIATSELATEDDLLVASSLPTDSASVFIDSRTLEVDGGNSITEDADATLCDESSSGDCSTAEPLPNNGNDVTYTLVNGQQPNSTSAAAQQLTPVVSRTYTKKMQQQQQKQHIPLELLTPANIFDLKAKILRYNERIRGKGSGLGITLIDEPKQLFRGFLRVHMNLTRPINVIAGKRPPSIYDIINEEESNNNNPNNPNLNPQQQRRTLTSFYMPRDTVKNIHITSESTSLQVIKAMLKKFKVVDNPQKFALYLRRRFPEEELQQQQTKEEAKDSSPYTTTKAMNDNRFEQAISNFLTPTSTASSAGGGNLYEHSLKRLHDQERPLVLQLEFDSLLYGAVDIVLQENDNADIAWDAFEVPELCNFLKILDREEAEHLEHVRSHYVELKRVIRALVEMEDRKCRAVDIPHPSSSSSRASPSNEKADSGGGVSGASSAVSVGS